MYIDFHGHSMKRNVFSYGCRETAKDQDSRKINFLAKMIPVLLHKRNQMFSLADSRYRIDKCKAGTARVVAFREMKIIASYTIESSFYGPDHSAQLENKAPKIGEISKDVHMSRNHLEIIGKDICKLLTTFLGGKIFRKRVKTVIQVLKQNRKIKTENISGLNFSKTVENNPVDTESDSSEYETENEDFNVNECLDNIDFSFLSDLDEHSDSESGSGGSDLDHINPEDIITLPTEESPKEILPPKLTRPEHKPIIKRSGSNERVAIIRPASVQPRKNSSAAPLAKLKLRVVDPCIQNIDSPGRFVSHINNLHKLFNNNQITKREEKKLAPLKTKMFLDNSFNEPRIKPAQIRVTNTGGGFRSSPVHIKTDN